MANRRGGLWLGLTGLGLLLYVIAEVAALIWVAGEIGWWTLLILLSTTVLGLFLVLSSYINAPDAERNLWVIELPFIIASVLMVISALVLFFIAGFWPGLSWLVVAFLLSPYGLPMAAAWLVGMIGGVNGSLKDFIFG